MALIATRGGASQDAVKMAIAAIHVYVRTEQGEPGKQVIKIPARATNTVFAVRCQQNSFTAMHSPYRNSLGFICRVECQWRNQG